MNKEKDENIVQKILRGPSLGYTDNFPIRTMWKEIAKELNGEFKIKYNSGHELEIHNISIRNQLKGRITKIIKKENRIYSLVDVGFLLVVSVTQASQQKMNLTEGKEVWCLFKSMALQVNV